MIELQPLGGDKVLYKPPHRFYSWDTSEGFVVVGNCGSADILVVF